MKIDLYEFTHAYAVAALWSTSTDDGGNLDDDHDTDDIAPETMATMRADCADFIRANRLALHAYAAWMTENESGEWSPSERAGHDFWLTRHHHGVGFWDRGLPGSLGERLTDAAQAYGSVDLWVDDEGKVRS